MSFMNSWSVENANLAMARSDIKSDRLRLFLRMAVAMRGGMTAPDFLSELSKTEATNGRSHHARVYKKIETRLRSGEFSLHEAMEDLTTHDDRCFLYAEEKVSDVSLLLQMAYDTAQKKKVIVQTVYKPFLMSGYLMFMAAALLILGGTVMLPNFIQMMPVSQWESPSRVVYYLGQVLMAWWPLVVLGIASSVAWVIWSLPNLCSEFRLKVLDRIFPWSLYKSLQSSNFILNMAAMFKAKVPILDAVRGFSIVATPYAAHYARRMRVRLESEQTSSDMRALDVGFIDRSTMDSMRILNNKLPADVVLQTIGDAEFELLADEVALNAQRIAKVVTVICAVFLLYSLYGTMSVMPRLTEQMMSTTQRR